MTTWTVYEAQYASGRPFGLASERLPDKVVAVVPTQMQADALIRKSGGTRWASPSKET